MHRLPTTTAIAISLCLAFLLGARGARAMDDYTVELQLSAAEISDLIFAEARTHQDCPEPIECPVGGGDCYLDHIEVNQVGTLHRGPQAGIAAIGGGLTILGVQPVQITQPVDVFVKSAACVEDPACDPEDYQIASTIELVFELGVESQGADVKVCAELVETVPALPLEGALGDFSACGSLPTNEFSQLTDGLTLQRRGVSLSADESRLAIRLDFSAAADTGAWASFLGGTLEPDPTASELAVRFDRQLLQRLFKGFVDLDQIPEVDKDGGQSVTWLPLGPLGAVVAVTSPGKKYVPGCWEIGLDVNSSFWLSFDDGSDELVIDASFEVDLDDGDMFGCAVLNPFTGGPALSAISLPMMSAIAHGFVPDAEEVEETGSVPEECKATGDASFTCRFPVELPALGLGGGPSAHLDFQGQYGDAEGYALVGDVQVMNTPGVPEIYQVLTPVQFRAGHDCNSVHASYRGSVYFGGEAEVCEVDLHNGLDPLGVFQVTETIEDDQLPALYEFEFAPPYPWKEDAYWQAPYAPVVTIHTTAGARSVSLGTPTELSEAQQQMAIGFALAQMSVDCTILSEGWLGDAGAYNPLWDIDPWDDVLTPVMMDDILSMAELESSAPIETETTTRQLQDTTRELDPTTTRFVSESSTLLDPSLSEEVLKPESTTLYTR